MGNKYFKYAAVFVFFITLTVFLPFVCPTVYVGDSGELITACYGLGIAHPPGYPLFTLMGKLFTFLPLASIAFRVNLMAAFFGSLACTVFFILLNSLFSRKYSLAALFSSLTLALGTVFFSQSLQAKGGIYTLNVFLAVLLLIVVLKYSYEKNIKFLYLAGLFMGLALANHHTALFMMPVVLYLIIKDSKDGWFIKTLFFSVITVLVAGVLYLYLPVRASAEPLINWGNPHNFERSVYHIVRGQYGALTANAFSFNRAFSEIAVFFELMFKEYYAFLLAALLGGYYLYKNKKILLLPSVFLVFSGLILLLALNTDTDYKNIETLKVFCMLSFLGAAILVFAGFVFLYEKSKLPALLLFSVFLIPVAVSGINTVRSDKTELAYKFNVNLLKTLPKGSLLFCYGDNIMFPLVYLNKVEKLRSDLFIYDDIGCIFKNIYGEDFVRLSDVEKNRVRRAVQLDLLKDFPGKTYFTLGSYLSNSGIASVPKGVLYLAEGPAFGKTEMDRLWSSYGDFDKKEIFNDYLLRDLSAQYFYFRGEYYNNLKDKDFAVKYFLLSAERAGNLDYFTGNISRKLTEAGLYREAVSFADKYKNAFTLLSAGIASYKQKNFADSENYFKEAVSMRPGFAEAYTNLGVVQSEKGEFSKAEYNLCRGLELEPGNINALIGLGVLHLKQGKIKLAEVELKNALGLDPSNKIALKYLEKLKKGS